MITNTALLDEVLPAATLQVVREEDLAQGADFYRCPACRELVDGSQMDAVRVHHGHVRHPAPQRHWLEFSPHETDTTSPAAPDPSNPPLRLWPNDSYEPALPTRSRR
jgi:hypothetical protein